MRPVETTLARWAAAEPAALPSMPILLTNRVKRSLPSERLTLNF